MEQLYPFDAEAVTAALAPYDEDVQLVWCQEEPKNKGAWSFIAPPMETTEGLPRPIALAGHGSKFLHDQEQAAILRQALEV